VLRPRLDNGVNWLADLHDIPSGTLARATGRQTKAGLDLREIYEGIRWVLFSNR